MLNSILANVIAGLGLLFSGLRMIDASLRQATGRRLRLVIGRLTEHPLVASLVGLLAGAVVQSTSGIVFILVSLVSSRLATIAGVLPIVTWANVGSSALIFLAVLDLRFAILYLVGVAGVAFAFDRTRKNHTLGALFGIGMLFYGIELMKAGAQPLREMDWFSSALDGNHEAYLVAFGAGAAFSFVTQSSIAISILAVGMAQTGLLGPFQTMMAIYGANVGSTFSRMLLSSGLRGSLRRIPAFQDLFKISGAVLFVALLYVESLAGIPLVRAFVGLLSERIDRQMAWVFLVFNLVMALVFTASGPAILRWLERRLPTDEQEDLAKPLYLYEAALDEPATALDLIAKEQGRLAERLRIYAEAVRAGPGSGARETAALVHKPFAAVVARIEQFQHGLMNRALGPQETERLSRLQSRSSLLVYMEDGLRALAAATENVPLSGRLGGLVSSLVESLDFVLLTLVDALGDESGDAAELLRKITSDRGALMERIRRDYLQQEGGATAQERAVLLQATSLFERVIWMAQSIAKTL
jgi:phosphate:Na+ symporter